MPGTALVPQKHGLHPMGSFILHTKCHLAKVGQERPNITSQSRSPELDWVSVACCRHGGGEGRGSVLNGNLPQIESTVKTASMSSYLYHIRLCFFTNIRGRIPFW